MAHGESTRLGLKLLRLTPLVISSASLMCGIDQITAIKPFTQPILAKDGSSVLPHWFLGFFQRTITVIAIAYPLATATALTNTLSYGFGQAADLTPNAKYFYWAGAAFSAGHFLYGPWAARLIARICIKENPGRKNTDAAREWLRMNAIRMWTVDGPGWAMYFCTVLSAVTF